MIKYYARSCAAQTRQNGPSVPAVGHKEQPKQTSSELPVLVRMLRVTRRIFESGKLIEGVFEKRTDVEIFRKLKIELPLVADMVHALMQIFCQKSTDALDGTVCHNPHVISLSQSACNYEKRVVHKQLYLKTKCVYGRFI